MMGKQQISDWLDTLPEDAEVGVNEGGLSLREHHGGRLYRGRRAARARRRGKRQ